MRAEGEVGQALAARHSPAAAGTTCDAPIPPVLPQPLAFPGAHLC